jgi:homocitrate synthase
MEMTDIQYKECTAKIKALADIRKLAVDDTDSVIRAFHANLHGKEQPLMEGLSIEEQEMLDLEGKKALENGPHAELEAKKRKITA